MAGITRKVVLKLAPKKFKIKVRDIKVNEIKKATEAFITSTTREIVPVVKIDNIKIGDGKVGKNTKLLIELFKKNTRPMDYVRVASMPAKERCSTCR